jgi:outer membrane protein OmpA-like peptidoglycan-associated protein
MPVQHATPEKKLIPAVHAASPTIAHPAAQEALPQPQRMLLHLQRQAGNRAARRLIARQGRGETEVSPDVETSIHQAQGSGQALEPDVRAPMEQFFETDFRDVRVHTDQRAEQLNRELDARAFTVGRDIFFRANAYQPRQAEGQELLAHELTHVTQQHGQAIQGKLTVSDPEDESEQEADRVSRAMSQKYPIGQSVLRQKRRVQRRFERYVMPHWGTGLTRRDSNMWFNPHAELWLNNKQVSSDWFAGNSPAQFTVAPGSSGSIRMVIQAGWFMDNMVVNYSGNAVYVVEVGFSTTAEGVVQFEEPTHGSTNVGYGAEFITPMPVAVRARTTDGYIVYTPTLRAEGGKTSTAGAQLTIGDKVQAGGGIGGEDSVVGVQSVQRSFIVQLICTQPQKPTIPPYPVYFNVRSPRINPEDEEGVARWYMALPNEVRRKIAGGEIPIVLTGHASTTGNVSKNRELSAARTRAVQRILRDVAGSDVHFKVSSLGEYEARTGENVESAAERRVDIEISDEGAKKP